jgi:lipoyl(octanoyl) transferase
MNRCFIVDLGFIGYAEAAELQKRLAAARKAGAIDDVLLLCEHPHVITMGRNGKPEHLLASERVLQQKSVAFYATDRGGDVTYHGPGQIVGYPILNLAAIRRDVGWYVRMLEETMIRASAELGVAAQREAGKTGIWVASGSENQESTHSGQKAQRAHSEEGKNGQERGGREAEKLGAIGVHLSRWVTSHGFAYNVSTDLRYFDLIVPCGIAGRKATSLEKLLGRRVECSEVASRIARNFAEVFGRELQSASRDELYERLRGFEQLLAVPA